MMKRIGLLSDTHGYFDEKLKIFFKDCDEIWHAGDIGNMELSDEIAKFKAFKAVYGNIDGHEVRAAWPRDQRFMLEETEVFMTHIGGYPGKYDPLIREIVFSNPPKLFISGHSHILKVMHDKKLGLLHINPGAAGKHGMHKFRTAVRFSIEGERIYDLEVWEVKR